jgi:polysaccharide transporter, PST family
MGLITYLGSQEPADRKYRAYFFGGLIWQAIIFLLVLILFLGQWDFFLGMFLQPVSHFYWISFFFLGLFWLLVSTYLQAVMLARQALPYYTLLIVFLSTASALLIWFYLRVLPLPYLLLLYLAGQGLTAVVAIFLVARRGWLPRWYRGALNKRVLSDFGKFILMALTLVICSKVVSFYVRDVIIQRFDLYQTGLWQAMVKLSDNYTIVFTSLVGMVYYPRLVALINEPTALRRYVRTMFYAVVPVIGLGLLLFYVLKNYFIIWLFNETFLPGAYLLDYLVIGDWFKMSAWLLSYLMMAQTRTKLYIFVQVVAALIYILLLFWLVGQYGLPGVTMAHGASFGLFLVFNLCYYRKLIF